MKPYLYDGPIPRDAVLFNPLGYRIRPLKEAGILEIFVPAREILRVLKSDLSAPEGVYVIVYYARIEATTFLVSTCWGTGFNPLIELFENSRSRPKKLDILRTYFPTLSSLIEAGFDGLEHSNTGFSMVEDPDTHTQVVMVSTFLRNFPLADVREFFGRPSMEALGYTLRASAALAGELQKGTQKLDQLDRDAKEMRAEAIKELLKELPDIISSIIGLTN